MWFMLLSQPLKRFDRRPEQRFGCVWSAIECCMNVVLFVRLLRPVESIDGFCLSTVDWLNGLWS